MADNRGTFRRSRKSGEFQTEDKQFDERTLNIDRVARVVKGGRRFRFRALVVVGDRKSRVGIGSAKGADVTAAVTKATDTAKKHMVNVSLYKGTLPHEAEAKVGGAHILIKPASAGTGLIAGGVVRTVLEVTGVHNALSKSLGSTNKTNTAYATVAALQAIEPSKNWVTSSKSNRAILTPNSNKSQTDLAKPEVKSKAMKNTDVSSKKTQSGVKK